MDWGGASHAEPTIDPPRESIGSRGAAAELRTPRVNHPMKSPPRLLALLTCLLATGCASMFGTSLEISGGFDRGPGSPDEIYIRAQRIRGLAGGVNGLVIPAGWRDLPRRTVLPGVAALETPLDLDWLVGRDQVPDAREIVVQGAMYPNRFEGATPLLVLASRHDRGYPVLISTDHEKIHEALAGGGDVYVLHKQGRQLKRGFTVYGAIGPPVRWVRLGEVELGSGEGPLAWTLTRSVGAVAYGLDWTLFAAAHVAALPLFPLGAGVVFFEQPAQKSEVPSTPW